MKASGESLKKITKKTFNFIFEKIGLNFANFENGFMALCYHRVAEKADSRYFLDSINRIPELFNAEISFLTRHFNIISLEEAIGSLVKKNFLPPKSMVITFDDGYKDNYINAYPILKKYKIPATIFLTTDFIDNDNDLIWTDKVAYIINKTKKDSITIPELGSCDLRDRQKRDKCKMALIEHLRQIDDFEKNEIIDFLCRDLDIQIEDKIASDLYLSSKEILEMSRNDIGFGSHSCSHTILTKISLKQAFSEIIDSKKKIEGIINKKVNLFAYPNGTMSDFNNDIEKIVKNAGYIAALTAMPGKNRYGNISNIFALKRITTGRTSDDFKTNLFLNILR